MADFDQEKSMHITTVTKLGMNTNVAALLCYVPLFAVNLVAPAVWLVSEPKNNYFLRFHSTQAVVLAVGYFSLAMMLMLMSGTCIFIPVLGHMLIGVFGILGFIAAAGFFLSSFFLMYSGFNNRLVKLPVIGAVSDKILTAIDNR